ncbi:restriction endonuclease subunit S [uncultured Psychrobacter sp.]|jgi:type I restriction-modification system DNA methylase subunit|uniref:restriction endonuclease subunit S n=1 Tax=uncultured Psychrobacter sp. TaxID=259303 RepID=UPI0030DD3E6B|tara:strand:- start:2798 stop:6673 length:3876 start_codon:yes stop_codon:yes gene_type:complete
MIDKSNFKDVLRYLDFEESGDIFFHRYADSAYLKVDFNKKELIYPEDEGLTVNERQTCNFSQNENFVVFECVHRLLAQGYKAEHIELEPKWQVGRGASGGRADVLIKDNQGDTLLIIECKTAGNEFSKAWNRTLQDGGQLFSYVKQTSTTQFICLYASNWVDEQVKSDYYLISLNDNESLIHELSELSDEPVLTYADSKLRNVEDIVATWKETYQSDYTTRGLFEPDIQPYFIGKKNYSLEDLETISSSDIQGKYNEFATIMRQHNVSGRENAFDKLVNLFLCKIVDETNNPQDLKFHWKGISYDSPFDLQDRLQALYQQGMKKFLDEDVTYVRDDEVETAFRFYKNDPVETQKAIKAMFRRLKFFTNNDFAFIDVHNERLFGQNSAVLLKIVKMLQDIRLKTNEENQFLGDMFEGFLDQGVKQSEGQFFTPMPIVKFIMNALPLDSLIATSDDIPKVIDYACGAGHFLNEYATSIRPTIEDDPDKNLAEYYDSITGIEKEYRLSKVAKVSAFMYGQDDINIIYADALGSNDDIKNNSYSVLVANPPYSVKGFLDTLKPSERRQYELLKYIDEKSYTVNNSIETFFIERAKQLLKTGGVAAIIVPSSILTKGKAASTSTSKNVYVATREILLKYFDIVAIAEFGSGTFGKTGTNTVTLFLRRKTTDAPVEADHYAERVNRWFNPVQASVSNNDAVDTSEVFADSHFIDDYCAHLELDADDYKTLLAGNPNQALLDSEYFTSYIKEFDKWSEIRNLKKRKSFKALSKDEQKAELDRRLVDYLKAVEKDKVYYFVLASLNPQPVLIIKSPSKTKEMKAFLGYEWSSAKGNEGIKYLGSVKVEDVEAVDEDSGEVALEEEDKRVLSNLYNLDNIHTPLYNPKDKLDANKINHLINQNFQQEQFLIPEELEPFVTKARLVDMLDFTVVDFNKAISLIPRKKISIDTKWALVKIKDICEIGRGRVINHQYIDENQGSYPVYSSQTKDNGIMGYINTFDFEGDYVTWTTDGIYAGTCFYRTGRFNCTNVCGTLKIYDEQIISYYYLSEALNKEAKKYVTQSANPKLMNNDMAEVKIPLPPINIQEQIINECQNIDDEVEEAKENISNLEQNINQAISDSLKQASNAYRLSDSDKFYTAIGKRVLSNEIQDTYAPDLIPVYSANVLKPFGYINQEIFEDYDLASVLWGIDGDWMVNYLPAHQSFFPTDHCGVIRVYTDKVNPKYLAKLLDKAGEAERFSRHHRASTERVSNLTLSFPDIDTQNQVCKEIEQMESKIAKYQAIIDASVDKKHTIIESYL